MPASNPHSASRGLVIAAPNSNTGKTVFTLGLVSALKARSVSVEVAKGGPGYIDPQFLRLATGQACYNLDKWAFGDAQLRARASEITQNKDLLIVEGMMGMFDGAGSTSGSTADVADTLDLPVLLLVNASGLAQSIAAIVHGFATLRARPKVCGVVATRVGSQRHADMLAEPLKETGIPLFGTMMRSDALTIPSRHLGLVQATENTQTEALVDAARDAVENGVDLDALLAAAGILSPSAPPRRLPPIGQRIAIASDIAFEFAYPHILNDWRAQGAQLTFFSPLANEKPRDDCDAIYLPGGYPELHAGALSSADVFLEGLRSAAERGALIYGECGGFMVLGEGLIDAHGERHAMAGLLSHSTSFAEKKMHLGYRSIAPQPNPIWKTPLRGHEFHKSFLMDAGTDQPLFRQSDAYGEDLGLTGGQRGCVLGSYTHIIDQAPTA
ncbi:MAG: cobyrinate a,c-diamide synthase [Pseudomonadota bacterium]